MTDNWILVAGGAGYIGSHVAKELTRHGVQTLTLDNFVRGHRELARWGAVEECDLADKTRLREIFEKYRIAAVFHLCAFTYVGESGQNPAMYYENNVGNTINLLNAMAEGGVQRFVFSSTCSTYGEPLEIPITETHPQNPVNVYARTKLMVETMLKDYERAYGMKHVNLRYFNAAGADEAAETGEWHEPETHLIPLILDAAAGLRKEITIFGTDYPTPDGTCVRDYIHVTDLARAHLLALDYLEKGGASDAFNLGNGKGFSVREVIKATEKVTGRTIAVKETGRRAGDPARLIGSSAKAKKMLGWEPRYPELEKIIETAWRWHRKFNKK
ncbi:MAG: UDP-glucose 4-epimerase GalE [Elusimicrobiaceae bacterium]|nr:UDP-glucose 4-epimerase GalE [Elusimicrobiaceae bacterium]